MAYVIRSAPMLEEFQDSFLRLHLRDYDYKGLSLYKLEKKYRLLTRIVLELAILMGGIGASLAAPSIISEEDFLETKVMAETILARYPPSKFHYVFIGRSLTLLNAYFDERDQSLATGIPLSDLREDRALTSQERRAFWEHMARFLPSKDQLGDKAILVIDHTIDGRSNLKLHQELLEYFRLLPEDQRPTFKSLALFFVPNEPEALNNNRRLLKIQATIESKALNFDLIIVAGSSFPERSFTPHFESFAKYRRHVLERQRSKRRPDRKPYLGLRSELAAFTSDESLSTLQKLEAIPLKLTLWTRHARGSAIASCRGEFEALAHDKALHEPNRPDLEK